MCAHKNSYSEIDELVLGKWILSNNKDFMIKIERDSITYYDSSKIKYKNPVKMEFSDSLSYFKSGNSTYNFMKNGSLATKAKIKEYDLMLKDTIIHTIIYIDKQGMDLMSNGRNVSFDKIP